MYEASMVAFVIYSHKNQSCHPYIQGKSMQGFSISIGWHLYGILKQQNIKNVSLQCSYNPTLHS
jgi:hypothetical protein